jgi:SAM-dependent methyltransferase
MVRTNLDASLTEPGDQRRLYGDLAWLWPVMSPPAHYRDEAAIYARLARAHARRPIGSVLHLGCGGGHIDHWLRSDFAVTGLDISPAMLANARALNPDVRYVEGDMRTARLGQHFDAVLLFDSNCYMLSEAELGAAFATAYAHLEPGGVFVTYAELLAETFHDDDVRMTTETSNGTTLTYVEYTFDPDPTDSQVETHYVYLIRHGATLRVEHDRHANGLFPKATWLDRLRAAGFEAAEITEPLWPEGFDDPVMFVAVRP